MKRMLLAGMILILLAVTVRGATTTWNGEGDWFASPTNWSGGVPNAGDAAVIASGSVLLSNSTPALATLMMNGGTLTFTNWTTALNAAEVVINSGSTLTCAGPFTNNAMSNRVWIAGGNVMIATNGQINVSGKGYAGGHGPGVGAGSQGGSYGGRGGGGVNPGDGYGFKTYGATNAPEQAGSGGSAVGNDGGGAVRIEATGAVTVNGSIVANGTNLYTGDIYSTGGGSGGGVYISCLTFNGSPSGIIAADGGNGGIYYGGSGGGGRIAVVYDSAAQAGVTPPGVRFETTIGTRGFIMNAAVPLAEGGTVYIPDAALLPLASKRFDGRLFSKVRLYAPGFTNWAIDSLVVSNCDFAIATPGFQLTVTNNILITSSGGFGVGPGSQLNCGGTLTVTNTSSLYLYSGPTNGLPPNYGVLLSVTGDVVVSPNSWIYPYTDMTNGGAPLLQMNNLVIAASGGINADNSGLRPGYGPGTGGNGGYGGGAGHGGVGGQGMITGDLGGNTNDSISAPMLPGSGGAGNNMGIGGGVVRIQAGADVTVNGTITANGGPCGNYVGGGGAGGTVYIQCNTFQGAAGGLISANGGAASYYGGSGGGGRIAVIYNTGAQSGVSPLPLVRFTTVPGGFNAFVIPMVAKQGTVYFPNNAILPLASGLLNTIFNKCFVYMPGFTNWALDSLTVSNCDFVFAEPGMQVTVTNNILITTSGGLGLSGASQLSCGGNLTMTNTAALYVYSGLTNNPTTPGALVSVGGQVLVTTNCWIYPYSHPTNGGSALFRMGSMTIAGGGGFNADGGGFAPGYGTGKGFYVSGYGGGASYGGVGGDDSIHVDHGGPTYGSSNAPVDPGSAATFTYLPSYGGGAVRIECDGGLTLDGTIKATGHQGIWYVGGAGSGGGIFIKCYALAGGGLLSAVGGNSGFYGGAGGGGRIAVLTTVPMESSYHGAYTVAGGAATYGFAGAAGTFTSKSIVPGILIELR